MTGDSLSLEANTGSFRLWLVRHGATTWNLEGRFCGESDIPLSPLGLEQALWLRGQLQSARIMTIYSSDLVRARLTAELLAPQYLSVAATALWRELAFGRWEGLTYAEIAALPENDLRFFTDSLHFAPPAGESLLDLSRRVQQGFALLLEAAHATALAGNRLDDVVLVSHGGPLRVLLCQLLHVPLEYQWQFQLAPGSLSAFDLSLAPDAVSPFASLALLNLSMQPSVKENQNAEV